MTNKFLLLASIFFISCAGPGTYKIYYEAIKNQIPGDDFLVIEEEFYKEQKYSFAYFKYGSKTPILLVLANTENGIFQWVSQDRASIFTNKIGKIIKTIGLDHDIYLSNYEEITDLSDEFTFYTNFYNPELLNILTFNKKLSNEIIEYEVFRDKLVLASKIRYLSELPAIKQINKNQYLIDEDGRALSSTQRIHPFLPEIEMYFYYK